MQRFALATAGLFLAGTFAVAEGPKDDVKAAAKKLKETASYSWTQTTEIEGGGQFRPGPSEGKTQKDGLTYVTTTFGDFTNEVYVKGEKGAMKTQDGWESLEELSKETDDQQRRFLRFAAQRYQNYKTPALNAEDLATKSGDFKKDGDAIGGELTEEGVRQFLSFGRGRGGANAPDWKDVSGSVKFWIKDGALAKYEYRVKGTREFQGEDRTIESTTTVEISDVDKTKIEVPDEVKDKL